MHYPKVVILIVNWNGWKDTIECLESVFINTYPNYQVVLLDNNSEDDSVNKIIEWAMGNNRLKNSTGQYFLTGQALPYICYDRKAAEQGGVPEAEADLALKLPDAVPAPLIIIRTGNNLGFAGGNNIGIRYAQKQPADYILLLNNDALFRSITTLTSLVNFMENHPDAGACGARLFYPDGSPQSSFGNFPKLVRSLAYLFPLYKLLPNMFFKKFERSNIVPDGSITKPIKIDYPSGACLMVRNTTIDTTGLMDEQYFMYVEETDWCFRMNQHGWERYYVPEAEVLHKFAGSFGNSTLKMRRYHLESLFKYFKKNHPPLTLLLLSTGYLIRSIYSILFWRFAMLLKRQRFCQATSEQALYWQLACKQAVETMQGLFLDTYMWIARKP
jgi:GT2 family glycosyltransferase